jgi:hypothetical protein
VPVAAGEAAYQAEIHVWFSPLLQYLGVSVQGGSPRNRLACHPRDFDPEATAEDGGGPPFARVVCEIGTWGSLCLFVRR